MKPKGEDRGCQPNQSPYTDQTVNVYLQDRKSPIQVHKALVEPYPALLSGADYGTSEVRLANVSQAAGHVLVHFLYTKVYQCLRPNELDIKKMRTFEFRTALESYVVARVYDMHDLEALTKKELETLTEEITVTDFITVSEEVYPQPGHDDKWFPDLVSICVLRGLMEPEATRTQATRARKRQRDPPQKRTIGTLVFSSCREKFADTRCAENARQEYWNDVRATTTGLGPTVPERRGSVSSNGASDAPSTMTFEEGPSFCVNAGGR